MTATGTRGGRAVPAVWLAAVCAVVITAAGHRSLPAGSREVVTLGFWALTTAVAAYATWTRRPDHIGWRRLIAAMAINAAGQALQLELLASAIALPLFLAAVPHMGEPRERSRSAMLDSLLGSTAVVGATWLVVLEGRTPSASLTMVYRLQPLSLAVSVLALATALHWVFRHDHLPHHIGVLALAGMVGSITPMVVWLEPSGVPLAASAASGLLLSVAMALAAVAAVGASVDEGANRPVPRRVLARLRIAMVVAAVLTPAAMEVGCLLRPHGGCGPPLHVIAAVILLAAALRLIDAVRSSEQDRAAVRSGERRFRALVHNAADGVVLMDAEGRILLANPAIARMTGTDVVGDFGVDVVVPESRADMLAAFRQASSDPGCLAVAHARTKRHPDRLLEMQLSDQRHDPDVGAFVANVRDVTDEHAHQQMIERLAYQDGLTGMPNRLAFSESLEQSLAADEDVAVLFCDLDRLKMVNDIHGHAAGDRMIIEVGRRLQDLVGPQTMVARVGGDEYLVALRGDDAQEPRVAAERIRRGLRRPIDLGEVTTRISCSIGVANLQAEASAEQLITDADAALYQAKRMGRDRVSTFDDALRVRRDSRRLIQSQLPMAIADHQLSVDYQPFVDATDGSVTGVEALVRWNHPSLGVLLPDAFLGLAEETGLLASIGWDVLDVSLAELAQCPTVGRMSVNVAAAQLTERGFATRVLRAVEAHGVAPSRLQLEITESTFIQGVDHAVRELTLLRDRGIRIALDDFGTGYASFAALEALPLDVLKIDRSLLQLSAGDGAVLRAVVAMAAALRLVVVVEGVETELELRTAQRLGADLVQGFHILRPAPMQQVLLDMADAFRVGGQKAR